MPLLCSGFPQQKSTIFSAVWFCCEILELWIPVSLAEHWPGGDLSVAPNVVVSPSVDRIRQSRTPLDERERTIAFVALPQAWTNRTVAEPHRDCMTYLISAIVANWQYVLGALTFVTTLLGVFVAWQVVRKGMQEIPKLKLEREAKQDEKKQRDDARAAETAGVVFKHIGIDINNEEWREVEVRSFSEYKQRFNMAKKLIPDLNLSTLQWFEIKASLDNSNPSFDVTISNVSSHEIPIFSAGVRILYWVRITQDMPYGGAPESFYELPIANTYVIGLKPWEWRPRVGWVPTDWGPAETVRVIDEEGETGEQKVDVLLKQNSEVYIINPGGHFRYKIVFQNWPLWASMVLRMWILTGSGERESGPLYVRHGYDGQFRSLEEFESESARPPARRSAV